MVLNWPASLNSVQTYRSTKVLKRKDLANHPAKQASEATPCKLNIEDLYGNKDQLIYFLSTFKGSIPGIISADQCNLRQQSSLKTPIFAGYFQRQ